MTKPHQSLADRTVEYIRKNGLINQGDHVLIAVSGGPDSVALFDILSCRKVSLGMSRITVAHFDHRLRGEESDADRRFVENLACRYSVDFRWGTAEVRDLSREKKVSLEMAARDCRHSFLRMAAKAVGARKLALGHTADDQAEEVLLRLFRGVGPAGLKAMLPGTAEGIIRPLLFAQRQAILEYLRERGLDYREDSSNSEPFCRRNSLRLRVLPILRETFHPGVARTIARYADLARDEESWWDHQVRQLWGACAQIALNGFELDLDVLRGVHPALLRRLLRHGIEEIKGNLSAVHAVHIEPLFNMVFLEMPGKSVRLPGGIEAVQIAGKLLLRNLPEESISADESFGRSSGTAGAEKRELKIAEPGRYKFGVLWLEVAVLDGQAGGRPKLGGDEAFMDAGKVKWPLLVRFWEPGDRFIPLGMKGSKKLQDFFTDSKIPRASRWKIPILCDTEKICWIAGHRLDDRVKTGPGTRQVLAARLVHSVARENGDE